MTTTPDKARSADHRPASGGPGHTPAGGASTAPPAFYPSASRRKRVHNGISFKPRRTGASYSSNNSSNATDAYNAQPYICFSPASDICRMNPSATAPSPTPGTASASSLTGAPTRMPGNCVSR